MRKQGKSLCICRSFEVRDCIMAGSFGWPVKYFVSCG